MIEIKIDGSGRSSVVVLPDQNDIEKIRLMITTALFEKSWVIFYSNSSSIILPAQMLSESMISITWKEQ